MLSKLGYTWSFHPSTKPSNMQKPGPIFGKSGFRIWKFSQSEPLKRPDSLLAPDLTGKFPKGVSRSSGFMLSGFRCREIFSCEIFHGREFPVLKKNCRNFSRLIFFNGAIFSEWKGQKTHHGPTVSA